MINLPTGCILADIKTLVPYAKNPKNHDEKDIELIIKSIKRNGWGDPLLVCPETMEVLSGNGRLMAAKKLGMEQVPVVYAPKGLTEKQKADLVIASNKLVEVSGYNDNLGVLIDEFGLDASDFGIEIPDFNVNQNGEETNFDDVVSNAKKEKVCPNCGYKLK
jgi:ParB-like chromosome segregation protein Spo0J